jgi:putative aminopeptidase FrvX
MNISREDLLKEILSQPTAPFREGRVIHKLLQEFSQASIPHFIDPVGNLVVGVSSKKEYLQLVRKKSTEPVRIFIAHMDHPGFHGIQWASSTNLDVQWHGGSPTASLENSNIWIADSTGFIGLGKLKNAKLISSGRALQNATVILDESCSRLSAKTIYGGFSFRAPVWEEGPLIYTKAADDLVGSFAVASVALDLYKKPKRRSEIPFIGLLTRAEEVGFIGAIGHFEQGWLAQAKRPVLCISLETSRTLPGAEIGKGPVVRLGDRFTVFDAGALRVFSELAQSILPGKHQRRIMDGGTCEGTAASVYGYRSVGISIPLGNYHNQSLEGGPDAGPPNGPAPEFVHKGDIEGLIQLCHGLLKSKLPWQLPWQSKLKELKKSFREFRTLLRTGP